MVTRSQGDKEPHEKEVAVGRVICSSWGEGLTRRSDWAFPMQQYQVKWSMQASW